ncbi:DMP19 family protein [Flaviaesturariibacter amylovorans]|uniref:DNA mimic protein DMP19 C-terminal domain-containing protein n=1 Tax=Flaviaesturariibacter amylovorans TaxID=1084520 RepID=A0ABP8HT63_9BACT
MESYSAFDPGDHLLPVVSAKSFAALRGWEFGWALLEPINIAADQGASEYALSRRLTPGQKALYFFWYLDVQVVDGGFVGFFLNGYGVYLPPLYAGLELIGDQKMLRLLQAAERAYRAHAADFDATLESNDVEGLYEQMEHMEELDIQYFSGRDNTMSLIERYARAHVAEFAKLQ